MRKGLAFPSRRCSKLLALLMALLMVAGFPGWASLGTSVASAAADSPASFNDVAGTRYEQAVSLLAGLRILTGYETGRFEPSRGISRAEMTAVLTRALNMDGIARKITVPSGFDDVPATHWANGYVSFAASRGLVLGVAPGRFAPNDQVTYAQAITMLVRLLGRDESAQALPWPAGYVMEASNLGIINGISAENSAPATRGDIALMAANALTGSYAVGGKTLAEAAFGIKALAVSPKTSNVTSGTPVHLEATVTTDAGKTFTILPQWDVTEGRAAIDSAGNVTLNGDWSVKVKASVGVFQATATINPISALKISPSNVATPPGNKIQLSAIASGPAVADLPVEAVWSLTSGVGTITSDGLFTAGVGDATVKAKYGSLEATATLHGAGSIVVRPSTVSLAPGSTQVFQAYVKSGDTEQAAGNVTWSVSGPGTITQDGTFTAAPGGVSTVTATVNGLTGTATVNTMNRIVIEPAEISIPQGQIVQLSAYGVDPAGGRVAISPTWTLDDKTIGIIDARSRLGGFGVGRTTLRASYQGMTAERVLTVIGSPSRISVSASPSSIPANGATTSTITARILDINGNQVPTATNRVTFAIYGSTYGTLSAAYADAVNGTASVTFTPTTTAGTVQIVATSTDLSGSNVFLTTTNPTLAKAELSFSPAKIAANTLSQTNLTVTLKDQLGATIPNLTGQTIVVNLSDSAAGLGTFGSSGLSVAPGASTATTTFRSNGLPGTLAVTGTTNTAGLTVQPAALTVATAGTASKLVIRTPIEDTKANNSDTRQIIVELQDASGTVMTGDYGTVVTLAATRGTATIVSPSVAVSAGIATFTVRSSVAGTVDFVASSGSNIAASAPATAKFTPGPAASVSLAVDPAIDTIAADGGATTVDLVATIKDAQGNAVTTATDTVTFTKTTANNVVLMPATTAVQAVNGVARITVSSSSGIGTESFKATAPGLTDSSTVSITAAIVGVPVKLSVRPISGFAAGSSTTVTVQVQDYNNRVVTGDNGRAITLSMTGGTVSTNPVQTQRGVATFTVTDTKAETVTATAVAGGLTSDAGQTFTVIPSSATRVDLTATPASLAADGTSRSTITSKLVDSYGNYAGAGPTVTLSLSDSNLGSLSSNTLYPGQSVTFTSRTTPGIANITGTSSYTVTPVSITTYFAGSPSKIVVLPPTPVPAGPYSGNSLMTVRVQLQDANGNVLTGYNTGTNNVSAVGLTVTGATGTTHISYGNVQGLTSFTPDGITRGSAGLVNGEATFLLSNTKAEAATLTPVAYIGTTPLTAVSATGRTIAGQVSKLVVTPSRVVLRADGSGSTEVSVSAADLYDNPVTGVADSVTFSLSGSAQATVTNAGPVALSGGTAKTIVSSNGSSGVGTSTLTARTVSGGLSGTATVITDLLPAQPTISVTDSAGADTDVGVGDPAARVVISASSRALPQSILIMVNGLQVPIYTTAGGSTVVDSLAAGSTSVTCYIDRADLGTSGVKSVSVILSSELGVSPVSATSTIVVH